MICDKCSSKMTPLIISWFCRACEDKQEEISDLFKGYILLEDNAPYPMNDVHYVYPNYSDAERWIKEVGLISHHIEMVLCETPFTWIVSRGTIKVPIAVGLYKIIEIKKLSGRLIVKKE